MIVFAVDVGQVFVTGIFYGGQNCEAVLRVDLDD
jgi:hypothetical protein